MSIWVPENLDSARKAADGKTILRVHDCGVTVVSLGKRYSDQIKTNSVFSSIHQAINCLELQKIHHNRGLMEARREKDRYGWNIARE